MNTPNENWADTAEVIKVDPPTPLEQISREATNTLLGYLKEAQGNASILTIESVFMSAMSKYKEST